MIKRLLTTVLFFLFLLFPIFAPAPNAVPTNSSDDNPSLFEKNVNDAQEKNYNIMKNITNIQSKGFDAESKKIIVISDVHIMAEKLLRKNGKAFQDYLRKDRKLLQESCAIAKELVEQIIAEEPDLVLVCGDMTKDGELLSHETFVEIFYPVVKFGAHLLVVPGNHDVDNPAAVYFDGDKTEKAETVSPQKFSEIYHDFGYGNAINRDKHSLSYVSEPIKGLQVIAIDACKYYDNKHTDRGDEKNLCVTEGFIKPETMKWLKKQAKQAQKNGKQVIAMVHHNVVEHFDYQSELSAPYLLENFKQVQQDFMEVGIEVVFTGHFHANDIAKTYNKNGNHLYDVETGSPVTYPCPYRIIEYKEDSQLLIATKFIEKIDYDLNGESFQTYAKRIIKESIPSVLSSLVKEFYPEIKQYTTPYSAFIKMPEANKLGQIVENNLGEIAVDIMMKIYEGNNDSQHNNIMLNLNKGIENIAGELARTRLLKGTITKSINNMDFVKKLKAAVNSIYFNMKGLNQQAVLSENIDKWMLGNREYIDDLNYPISLQKPQASNTSNTDLSFPAWKLNDKWAKKSIAVELK